MLGPSVSAGSQGSEKSVNALTPIILIVFRFVGVDLMGQEINQYFTKILASGIFVCIRGTLENCQLTLKVGS